MIYKDVNFTELAKFQSKQLKAYETLLFNPKCKYLLFGGAAGGGKSYFLRWAALGLGFYYSSKYNMVGVPLGLFSEDYPTLRDRQIIKIKREFPPWLGQIKETKAEGFAFITYKEYGGFIIMLRNLDDPSKYSSVEFAAILVEELTKNKLDTFEALRTRMRYTGIPDVKFAAATNPGEIGHGWVKNKWIQFDSQNLDIENDRFFFIQALYSDNKYIDPDYVRQLEALSDPLKRKALLEGNWDIFVGQVFFEWNRDLHVTDKFLYSLDDCQKIVCFDWGYNAPGCAYWLAFTPDLRVYCYREIYKNQLTPEEWAQEISMYTLIENTEYIVLPHDCFYKIQGRETIETTFRNNLNIPIVYGGAPSKQSRRNRLAIMHQYLSKAPDKLPYLQFHPSCVEAVRTLPELIYDKNNPEDLDTRGDDHSYDAISLGLLTHRGLVTESGIVKPALAQNLRSPVVVNEQGRIPSPDFWTAFKDKQFKRGHNAEFGK